MDFVELLMVCLAKLGGAEAISLLCKHIIGIIIIIIKKRGWKNLLDSMRFQFLFLKLLNVC